MSGGPWLPGQQWNPPDVDTKTPNVGRMYDYYLGGKDNYRSDRDAAETVRVAVPGVPALAWENRRFLGRAVRFMIRTCGIDQFLDIGTGLPTRGHVHEVTGAECPAARVVYVDNEPVVLAHARALIPPNGRTAVVDGDMREPEKILADPAVRGLIDFSRPVGVLLVAMLHFATDADDPTSIVGAFTARMAAGSALAISHVTADGPPETARREAEAVYTAASAPVVFRSRAEITGLFAGLDVVSPGVTYVPDWRPDDLFHVAGSSRWLLGGVGVVPDRSAAA